MKKLFPSLLFLFLFSFSFFAVQNSFAQERELPITPCPEREDGTTLICPRLVTCPYGALPPTETPDPCECPPDPICRPNPDEEIDQAIIIGDTFPEEISVFNTLTVDEDPKVFGLYSGQPNVYKVQAQGASWAEGIRGSGYAMAFSFSVKQGQNIDILAKELDIETVGSYVGNHLYDPNGNRISWSLGSTRAGITSAPADGTYHLIVQTFEDKEGRAQIQVYDKEGANIKATYSVSSQANMQTIDQPLPLFLSSYLKTGRRFFDLKMHFPTDMTLNQDNTIDYFDRTSGQIMKIRPRVLKSTEPNLYQRHFPFEGTIPTEITRLDTKTVLIKPQGFEFFDKGYYYALISEIGLNVSSGSGISHSFLLRSISTSSKTADLDNDGRVGISDYAILSAEFGQTKSQYDADINLDGRVSIADYAILSAQFGR